MYLQSQKLLIPYLCYEFTIPTLWSGVHISKMGDMMLSTQVILIQNRKWKFFLSENSMEMEEKWI